MLPIRTSRLGNIAAASLVFSLAACASSPQLDANWADSSLRPASHWLAGGKVLVACDAQDVAIRQICNDQFASEVVARGATPVFAPSGVVLLNDRSIDGQLVEGAKAAGARALLVVTLAPSAVEARGSGFSFGIGGFGLGSHSALGVGVSAPIGGTRVSTGFSANGRVTDAATGKLIWSATAAAAPSEDLAAQFAALAKTVLDSAERSGLF